MGVELPTVDYFRGRAEEAWMEILLHCPVFVCNSSLAYNEIAKLVIARALLHAYISGGNKIFDDIEQKLTLLRADPITKA